MLRLSGLILLVLCMNLNNAILAQEDTRLKVPSKADQSASYAMVKELFEDQLKDKATLDEAFIRSVLNTANETNTASDKYALYQLALEQTVELGQPSLYLEIVEAVEAAFDNGSELWVSSYPRLARNAPKEDAATAHGVYGELIALCLAKNDFLGATNLARAGTAYVRTRYREFSKEAQERQKRVRVIENAFNKVEPALSTLKQNPADPAANTTVGVYKCFILGDWDAGLSYLEKGEDEELKGLAQTESLKPESAEHQMALADLWMKAAEKHKLHKRVIQARAAEWYNKALPELKGLHAIRVQKILDDMEPVKPKSKKVRGKLVINVDEKADIYVNGKKVFHVPSYLEVYEAQIEVAMGDIVVIEYENLHGPGGVTMAFVSRRFSFVTKGNQWVLLEPGTKIPSISLRTLKASKQVINSIGGKADIRALVKEKSGVEPETIEAQPNRGKFIIATVITKNSLVPQPRR